MKPLMKLAVLALLVSAACTSCSSKSTTVFNAPVAKVDKSVAVFTPVGFGRGCPVNGLIVTAQHLLKQDRTNKFYNIWWSDNYGHDGYAVVYSTSRGVDGAALQPEGPEYPIQVKVGKPVVGEEVYWFDYRYDDDSLASQLHRAKLVRRIAGHLVLSEGATSGASGGCIFNRKGEAIGIIVWVLTFETKDPIGIGLQFPKEWS